jgi:hypothetical protein
VGRKGGGKEGRWEGRKGGGEMGRQGGREAMSTAVVVVVVSE